MSSLVTQLTEIEAGLSKLQDRLEDLPITEILISRLLINLGREMNNRLDERLRPYGLTEAEFRALVSLHSFPEGSANPGDLCGGMGQSPANITRITDVLVERGLILRLPDAHDRRRLVLQVTPQGVTLLNELLPLMMEGVRESYRSFTPAKRDQLLASLKALAAAIDQLNDHQSEGGT